MLMIFFGQIFLTSFSGFPFQICSVILGAANRRKHWFYSVGFRETSDPCILRSWASHRVPKYGRFWGCKFCFCKNRSWKKRPTKHLKNWESSPKIKMKIEIIWDHHLDKAGFFLGGNGIGEKPLSFPCQSFPHPTQRVHCFGWQIIISHQDHHRCSRLDLNLDIGHQKVWNYGLMATRNPRTSPCWYAKNIPPHYLQGFFRNISGGFFSPDFGSKNSSNKFPRMSGSTVKLEG